MGSNQKVFFESRLFKEGTLLVLLLVLVSSQPAPSLAQQSQSESSRKVKSSVPPEYPSLARQMGIKVTALTWISNMCSGMKGASLNHSEVLELGAKVSEGLRLILSDFIKIA